MATWRGLLLAAAPAGTILVLSLFAGWRGLGTLAPGIAGLAVLLLAHALTNHVRLSKLAVRAERLAAQGAMPARASGDAIGQLDDGLGEIDRLIGSIQQRLSHRHPLSGLPTREPLFDAIEQAVAQGGGGLLGVLSLTDFERLNAFDPDLAEQMLVEVVLRATRMLGERRLLAQVDRARFGIWYSDDVPEETARAQLAALAYALGGTIRIGDRELVPEVRIGVACAPQDASTPHGLLARAIAALSLGSGDGEESAVVDVDPVEAARERYAIEQDLRRAIERAEFELRFQPLIDAEAGRVFGAEALLRWFHPVRGSVPPSRFIPIVEEAGLAQDVGLWALNAACREARDWQRQGLGSLRVAVNISGRQLDRGDLAAQIERTLIRHSLNPQSLGVELTETVAASDTDRTARLFRHLREMGVTISIDDFGTGYSSFSTLRTLVFDKIKIDREFVTSVDSRRDSQAICRSILALGQGLGTRVLAEGVERREEYEWLRRAGCTHFQGYYFSVPLEADEFQAFARDNRRLATLLAPFPTQQPERLRA